MRKFQTWAAVLVCVPLFVALTALAQSPAKTAKPAAKKHKVTASAAAKKRAGTAQSAPARKSTGAAQARTASKSRPPANGRVTTKRKKPVSRTTWRNRQLAPTPDRYKEIQTALAAKGFLRPEDATGQWNDVSAQALKKFQAEQNLEATGKLNSLSLIALGLGPKHLSSATIPATAPAPGAPAATAQAGGQSLN